jgi:hypothetical protein
MRASSSGGTHGPVLTRTLPVTTCGRQTICQPSREITQKVTDPVSKKPVKGLFVGFDMYANYAFGA